MPGYKENITMILSFIGAYLLCIVGGVVGGCLIGDALIKWRNSNAATIELTVTNIEPFIFTNATRGWTDADLLNITNRTKWKNSHHTNGEPPLLKWHHMGMSGEPKATAKTAKEAIVEDTETGALYLYRDGKWQKYVPQP